jgi:tetratricopeptide (TPR) repeat protein
VQFDAHLLSLMGVCEYNLHDYAPAEIHLRQALAVHRKVNGGKTADAVEDGINLMLVLGKSKRYAEGRKFGREAVGVIEQVDKPDDLWSANSHETFAWQLFKAGHHAEGRAQIQRAMMLRQRARGDSTPTYGNDLYWLAQSFSRSGLLEEATTFARRAMEVQLKNADIPDAADDALLLGFILGRRGPSFAMEADKQYRHALEIRGPNGGIINICQIELAFAAFLLEHGGAAEAEHLLRDVHERAVSHAATAPYVAAAAQYLARIATQRGETKQASQWSAEVPEYCQGNDEGRVPHDCETIRRAHLRCGMLKSDPLDCSEPGFPDGGTSDAPAPVFRHPRTSTAFLSRDRKASDSGSARRFQPVLFACDPTASAPPAARSSLPCMPSRA